MNQDLQSQIDALYAQVQKLDASSSITRDSETSLRERLGLNSLQPFPIGAIFISVVSTNPNILLGYGTWTAFGTGRTLVGIDTGQTEFDVVEETGGAKTHTLTTAEMPAHTHTQELSFASGGITSGSSGNVNNAAGTTSSTGGGGSHNNLQPYIVVYFWKRTA